MFFPAFALLLFLSTHPASSASSKVKVACVGNSITEGNMGGVYPTQLQTLLGSKYQVENDGVSGTTMLKKGDKPYWTQGKLPQVFAFKPNIITIKLGTNDTKPVNWDNHSGEFKKDYLSMIDTFLTLSTKPAIFLVLPAPVFKPAYNIRDSVVKKIIVMVKEIGNERGIPVIDVNTPLLSSSALFPDGVHPNAAGSDSIAHIIYRAITASTSLQAPLSVRYMRDAELAPESSIYGLSRPSEPSMIDLSGRLTPCNHQRLTRPVPAILISLRDRNVLKAIVPESGTPGDR